ncbi:MAG: MarR family transcriptional regulator [Deltaproteobacteria bacterium]|nr:MarR family transcriptional regulator [Deltaproteobacteria bacterium]
MHTASDVSPGLEFGFLLGTLSRAWRGKLNQRLKGLGVTAPMFIALGQLSRAEKGLIQRELADRLAIEGPTLVRLVDRLEADGWVRRRPSDSDRRQNVLVLTDKALPALERMREVARGLHDEALRVASEAELQTVRELFRKLLARLEEI